VITALAVENYRSLRRLVLAVGRLNVVTGSNGSGSGSGPGGSTTTCEPTRRPQRTAQIGTRTPVLSHDGADLAAALQTIREIGDAEALDEAVGHAFPGSHVEVTAPGGRFELALRQPGLLRPLRTAELSDGTLRYLLWAAALLTPRPPEMLVLNEPETSLHPELIGPLADLIIAASANTQIIVVTHAQPLVTAFQDSSARMLELVKEDGRTLLDGQSILDEPTWHWPSR
jgi:predicted ATPase